MSTQDIVRDPHAEGDVGEKEEGVNITRVHALTQHIICKNCLTVVSDCNVVLYDMSSTPETIMMTPRTGIRMMLEPKLVQIHKNQLFVVTGGIELSTRILKMVSIEITHLNAPIECDCIERNIRTWYQLEAVFPLCHHTTGVDDSTNTIMTFLGKTCSKDHSELSFLLERHLEINMIFISDDNTWESLPKPKIKLRCDNITKSASKR